MLLGLCTTAAAAVGAVLHVRRGVAGPRRELPLGPAGAQEGEEKNPDPCRAWAISGAAEFPPGWCHSDGLVRPYDPPPSPPPTPPPAPPATPNAIVLASLPATSCPEHEFPGDVLHVRTDDGFRPLYGYNMDNCDKEHDYSSSTWPSVQWAGPQDPPPASRRLSEAPVCDPTSWTGYDGEVCTVRNGGECAALVNHRDNGGDCEYFCALQGRTCTAGWDDADNNQCSLTATLRDCDFDFNQIDSGTSDTVCECGPVAGRRPAPVAGSGNGLHGRGRSGERHLGQRPHGGQL